MDDYYRQIESSWRGANERPLHAPNVFYEKCGGDAETARRIRDDACAAAAAGSTRDLFWFLKDWSPAYRPPPAESGPAAGRAKAAAAKPWYEDDDQVDELIREANRRGIR